MPNSSWQENLLEDRYDAGLLRLVFYHIILLRNMLTNVGWLDSEKPGEIPELAPLFYIGGITWT